MLSKIVIPIAAIILILYVALQILTSGGSALSEAMIYLAVGGLGLGLLNPKAGMLFVCICGNYLDFLKRFLIVEGGTSFLDVIKTLAVPPVAMTGVIAGIIVNYSKNTNMPFPVTRFAVAILISLAVVGAGAAGGQSISGVLQVAANSALYVWLIAFAGPIYRDLESQHRTLQILVIIFIPVVLYGWIQLIYGYTPIEVAYARSGFTVCIQPLMNPNSVEYNRVFSTMGSSNAYSLVGTILSIYALLFGFGKGVAKRLMGVAFAIVCLGSQIPGAGRTSWAILLITILVYFIFQYSSLTKLIYLLTSVTGLVFFSNAEKIGVWLVHVSQAIGGKSDFALRALNMGTFTTRTTGIAEWMSNGRYFSWFGLPKTEAAASSAHDLIGQIYVTTGVVGLCVSILCAITTLVYLHSNLLKIENIGQKKLGAFYMANIFSVLFSGIFSGSALHIFPLNLYFWLMTGLLFQVIDINKQALNTAQPKEETPERRRFLRSLRPAPLVPS